MENGTQCNTRQLLEEQGFSGLLMDGSHHNESINLKEEYISVHNILSLFAKYKVPRSFDVLSVDLDMFDWWVLERILNKGAYRPRMIVVEVNPTLGHYKDTDSGSFSHFNSVPLVVTHPQLTTQTYWDHSRYFGANPKAFQLLGEMYGDYEMVYCESCGVNCFLVQQHLLPKSCRPPPPPHIPRPCYFHSRKDNSTAPGHAPDSLKRKPLLLTAELLTILDAYDSEQITEDKMHAFVFRTDENGNADETVIGSAKDAEPDEETLNSGVLLALHFLLFVFFLYYCCC